MKLAIVGSRDFLSYAYLAKTIGIYFSQIDEIVSGGAHGADSLGARYAQEHNIPIKVFPADWNAYGKSAGHIRNKQIVDEADIVAAYWDGKSRGTKGTINIALKNKKPIIIFIYSKHQIVTLNWEPLMEEALK